MKKIEPVSIKIGESQLWFCPDAKVESDSRALDINNLTSLDFAVMQQLASDKGYEMNLVPHKFVDSKLSDEWRTGSCKMKRPPKGSKEYSFISPDASDSGGLSYYVSVTPDQKVWSIISLMTVSLEELVGGHSDKSSEE